MINKTKDGILVNIKISPNSKKNEIIKDGDIIKIKITAQPIDGKANKAVIEFLSKHFKIPKTSIKIVKGETSKEKTILFETSNPDKVKILKDSFSN